MGHRLRAFRGFVLLAAASLVFAVGCPKSEPDPKTVDKKDDATPAKALPAPLESTKPDATPSGDTLVALLETLPKDLWPKDDKDTAKLDGARKWLTANLAGKRAIVTSSLERINIIPPSKPGEKFRVTLTNGSTKNERLFFIVRGFGKGGKISNGLDLWGLHWSVELRKPDADNKSATSGLNLTVEKPELDRLRTLEMEPGGPEARLTFTINEIGVAGNRVTISVKDLVIDKAE